MADKAYASKANRKLLRDRGIAAVVPERSDHIANRKRLGHMLKQGVAYEELGIDHYDRTNPERAKQRLLCRMQSLGYEPTLTPLTAT
jgi:hypothetical protein